MKNSETIKKHWPEWYEMMHWNAKAKGVGLSWRKPWRIFRWYYYMRKASNCIPKNMKMHRKLFGLLAFALIFNSCGSVQSDEGIRATIVPGPAGVTCYAIIENGRAVGGNCK